jgi:hypothetical protein
LVNGSIDIPVNIDVPEGSSLVFIASGDINFANNVSKVEGIFMADGTISTGTGQTLFVGEGSFIGGGIRLGRDFQDERNNTNPSEQFIFRPDFFLNTLTQTWKSAYHWQELAP